MRVYERPTLPQTRGHPSHGQRLRGIAQRRHLCDLGRCPKLPGQQLRTSHIFHLLQNRVVVDHSELVSPTTSVIPVGVPLMNKTVLGVPPFLWYHRSGHFPQPCCRMSGLKGSYQLGQYFSRGLKQTEVVFKGIVCTILDDLESLFFPQGPAFARKTHHKVRAPSLKKRQVLIGGLLPSVSQQTLATLRAVQKLTNRSTAFPHFKHPLDPRIKPILGWWNSPKVIISY